MLEAQVRAHFSVQNQLKLHIEITEGEHETAIKDLKKQIKTVETDWLKKHNQLIKKSES